MGLLGAAYGLARLKSLYAFDMKPFIDEGIISTTLDNGQVVLSDPSVLKLNCKFPIKIGSNPKYPQSDFVRFQLMSLFWTSDPRPPYNITYIRIKFAKICHFFPIFVRKNLHAKVPIDKWDTLGYKISKK